MKGTRASMFGAGILFLVAPLAACGDDSSSDDGIEAYCDLAREMNEQEGSPSNEQMDAIADAAPAEIAGDVETLLGAIREGTGALFDTPEVTEASENVSAFESEHCGVDARE